MTLKVNVSVAPEEAYEARVRVFTLSPNGERNFDHEHVVKPGESTAVYVHSGAMLEVTEGKSLNLWSRV